MQKFEATEFMHTCFLGWIKPPLLHACPTREQHVWGFSDWSPTQHNRLVTERAEGKHHPPKEPDAMQVYLM